MPTQLDLDLVADYLRSNSGSWMPIRRDATRRVHALLAVYRRRPPRAFPAAHFDFQAKGCGYGTGEAILYARHMPATIPIDPRRRSALDS